LKALTSGSSDFSKQGFIADAANPNTDFFNEICQILTFSDAKLEAVSVVNGR
jgi:hypothetical protein